MSYEDALRAHQEHLAISMRHPGIFAPAKVSAEIPEPYAAPEDDGAAELTYADVESGLTHDDLLSATLELAARHEVTLATVQATIHDAHVRAGLGYSVAEKAAVLGAVSAAMDRGSLKVSREQVLELSGRGQEASPGDAHRAEVLGEAMILGLTVTAAERRKYAKSGVALKSGAFPIADVRHLAAAKSEYAKGNFAGHSKAEVRAHINKRARALGEPGLDDDGDGDEAGMTADLAAEVDRLSGVVLELARHPAKSGRKVTTRTRAHVEDEDPTDTGQPAKGGEVHAKVRAIIEANPDLFTDGKGRTPSLSTSHPSRKRAG